MDKQLVVATNYFGDGIPDNYTIELPSSIKDKTEAQAECDRLNALLEDSVSRHDYAQMLAERDRLIAEVARLREALRRYADHDEDCDQIRYTHRACTCGYREALAQEVENAEG